MLQQAVPSDTITKTNIPPESVRLVLPHVTDQVWMIHKPTYLDLFPDSLIASVLSNDPTVETIEITNEKIIPEVMDLLSYMVKFRIVPSPQSDNLSLSLLEAGKYLGIEIFLFMSDSGTYHDLMSEELINLFDLDELDRKYRSVTIIAGTENNVGLLRYLYARIPVSAKHKPDDLTSLYYTLETDRPDTFRFIVEHRQLNLSTDHFEWNYIFEDDVKDSLHIDPHNTVQFIYLVFYANKYKILRMMADQGWIPPSILEELLRESISWHTNHFEELVRSPNITADIISRVFHSYQTGQYYTVPSYKITNIIIHFPGVTYDPNLLLPEATFNGWIDIIEQHLDRKDITQDTWNKVFGKAVAGGFLDIMLLVQDRIGCETKQTVFSETLSHSIIDRQVVIIRTMTVLAQDPCIRQVEYDQAFVTSLSNRRKFPVVAYLYRRGVSPEVMSSLTGEQMAKLTEVLNEPQ